ncbi:MAG TPA: VOC family protein [Ilumatobacteraceae bacterium]
MIRLRQVVVAARDLGSTVDTLSSHFGLRVCFTDPGVAEFGLENALMVVGDQFIEVVAPIADNSAAGRLLDRRKADVTSYMVMFEVDDLDQRMAELGEAHVRTVWSGDYPMICGRHLHPGDIGGAIVSLDQTDPPGSWLWGGPTWTGHNDNSVVTSIAGYRIAVDDPQAVTTMWSIFGLLHGVAFVDGMTSTIELTATDRTHVGHTIQLDQITVRLV